MGGLVILNVFFQTRALSSSFFEMSTESSFLTSGRIPIRYRRKLGMESKGLPCTVRLRSSLRPFNFWNSPMSFSLFACR